MKNLYIKKGDNSRRAVVKNGLLLASLIATFTIFSNDIINLSFNGYASLFSRGFFIKNGELDELLNENERLTAEIVKLRIQKDENDRLRSALSLGMDKEFSLSIATIISKSLSDESILLNRGEVDGIKEGMAVITEEQVVVGSVSKVLKDFSRVDLITKEGQTFEAEVQGKGVVGLLTSNGSSLKLSLIPKEVQLSEGDALITASLSDFFPPKLLIGLISEVDQRATDSMQEAEVRHLFDLSRREKLFIILDSYEENS